MYSMTGFGKGAASDGGGNSVTVELSGVNRKQLDLHLNLPREFAAEEPRLRKAITAVLRRGTVNCRVGYVAAQGAVRCCVDAPALDGYIRLCEEAKRRTGTEAGFSISELLVLPGVVKGSVEPDESLLAALDSALKQALDAMQAMRLAEGEALRRDFEERLAFLEGLLKEIEPVAGAIASTMKQRLLDKLAAEKIPVPDNDGALLREALFYADKCDVTEEITRIRSHFAQFRAFLLPEANDAGRSLDFLMQELFREITTLGNKAGGAAVSPLVVRFKTELEKLREQIQNVE